MIDMQWRKQGAMGTKVSMLVVAVLAIALASPLAIWAEDWPTAGKSGLIEAEIPEDRRRQEVTGSPVSFHSMRGLAAHYNGFQTIRALGVLMTLLGTIDRPGGFRHKAPFPRPIPPCPKPPKGPEGVQPNTPLDGMPLGFPADPEDLDIAIGGGVFILTGDPAQTLTLPVLVTNNGGPPAGYFDHFEDGDFAAAHELTLMSAVRMIRCVLPPMRQRGSGSILTITSTTIKEPLDNLLLSNVFRAGVVALVKSLSNELGPEGIRVNAISAGAIKTLAAAGISGFRKMQSYAEKASPLRRTVTIEEVGNTAAFLCSDLASGITGETTFVDAGVNIMGMVFEED